MPELTKYWNLGIRDPKEGFRKRGKFTPKVIIKHPQWPMKQCIVCGHPSRNWIPHLEFD